MLDDYTRRRFDRAAEDIAVVRTKVEGDVDFADIYYVVIGMANPFAPSGGAIVSGYDPHTAGTTRINVNRDDTGAAADISQIMLMAIGDQ